MPQTPCGVLKLAALAATMASDGTVTYRGRLGEAAAVPPPDDGGAAPAAAARAARPPLAGRKDDRSFLVRCGASARGDMRVSTVPRGACVTGGVGEQQQQHQQALRRAAQPWPPPSLAGRRAVL